MAKEKKKNYINWP